jgi:hypothetical protein
MAQEDEVEVLNWRITFRAYRHAFDMLMEQTIYGPLPDPRQKLEDIIKRWPQATMIQIEMEKNDGGSSLVD